MASLDVFPFKSFYQGDTFDLNLNIQGYYSSEWTLTYTFRKAGQAAFQMVSTPVEDGLFSILVLPAVTSAYTPGLYIVTASLTDADSNKFTIDQQEIIIRPDVSLDSNSDPRTVARIALDDVNACLAAGAGSDMQEYTVGGTTIKKNREGLLALRAHYLKLVRAENGIPAIGSLKYYF